MGLRLPGRLAFRLGRRLPPNVRHAINAARGIDTPVTLPRPPGHRVAVLAPHPDDELLGCGGTMQKHRAAGESVDVVLVTSGERTASFAGTSVPERRARSGWRSLLSTSYGCPRAASTARVQLRSLRS